MNKKFIAPKIFTYLLDNAPICTVDVMFFNKDMNKVVLFRRENKPLKGKYFAVGGRLLKKEKLIDGAIRQAMRECGLRIKKINLKYGGVEEAFFKNSAFKGISYHAICIYYSYIVNEINFDPKLDNQHSAYKWFSVKDRKIHPLLKKRITNIINSHKHGKEL